jgi:hypothetical protein
MRLKTIAVLVLVALLTFASGVKAQTDMAEMPMGSMNSATLVKGSENPNSIPRLLVARLWFQTQTSSPDGINDVDFGVPSVGFTNPSDATALANAMSLYQKTQTVANASYKTITDSGSVPVSARDNFWNAHNNLVANILSGLTLTLTPDGLQQFYTFLENKKGGVYASPYDHALGVASATLRKELYMVAGSPQSIDGMNGNYSILLQSSVLSPKYSFADSFSRTGSFVLPYSVNYGAWTLASAGAEVTYGGGDGEASVIYESSTFYNQNQCVSATLGTLPAAQANSGPSVHMSSDRKNGYFVSYFKYTSGAYGVGIIKLTNGNYSTPLGNTENSYFTGATPAIGDTITICAMGQGPLVHVTEAVTKSDGSIVAAQQFDDNAGITQGYPGMVGSVGGGALKNFTVSTGHRLHTYNSVSGDSICPSSCSGFVHHAEVHAMIGTQGVNVIGPKVLPTSYISAVNNDDITIEPIQPSDEWDFVAEIICSQVGRFLALNDSPNPPSGATWQPCWTIQPGSNDGECSTFWLATTAAYTVGYLGSGTSIQWQTELNCTPATTLPDYVPSDMVVPYQGTASEYYRVTGKTPLNWTYRGICIAPPLGNHAGQFFCVSEGPMGGLFSINPTYNFGEDIYQTVLTHSRRRLPCTRHHQWYN